MRPERLVGTSHNKDKAAGGNEGNRQVAREEDEVAQRIEDALEYALETGWTLDEIRDEVQRFYERTVEPGELMWLGN